MLINSTSNINLLKIIWFNYIYNSKTLITICTATDYSINENDIISLNFDI